MGENEIMTAMRSSGVSAQVVAAVGITWIAWRVRVIETRLGTVCKVLPACAQIRAKLPIASLLLMLVFLILLCGCVQTRFEHAGTVMTRTAVLTKVSVPRITIATNGTMTASVDSDARTELIESVLRALTAAAK